MIVNQHLKFDEIQNAYLTETLVFLAGTELKKNKLILEKIELTHLYKESKEEIPSCRPKFLMWIFSNDLINTFKTDDTIICLWYLNSKLQIFGEIHLFPRLKKNSHKRIKCNFLYFRQQVADMRTSVLLRKIILSIWPFCFLWAKYTIRKWAEFNQDFYN